MRVPDALSRVLPKAISRLRIVLERLESRKEKSQG